MALKFRPVNTLSPITTLTACLHNRTFDPTSYKRHGQTSQGYGGLLNTPLARWSKTYFSDFWQKQAIFSGKNSLVLQKNYATRGQSLASSHSTQVWFRQSTHQITVPLKIPCKAVCDDQTVWPVVQTWGLLRTSDSLFRGQTNETEVSADWYPTANLPSRGTCFTLAPILATPGAVGGTY